MISRYPLFNPTVSPLSYKSTYSPKAACVAGIHFQGTLVWRAGPLGGFRLLRQWPLGHDSTWASYFRMAGSIYIYILYYIYTWLYKYKVQKLLIHTIVMIMLLVCRHLYNSVFIYIFIYFGAIQTLEST